MKQRLQNTTWPVKKFEIEWWQVPSETCTDGCKSLWDTEFAKEQNYRDAWADSLECVKFLGAQVFATYTVIIKLQEACLDRAAFPICHVIRVLKTFVADCTWWTNRQKQNWCTLQCFFECVLYHHWLPAKCFYHGSKCGNAEVLIKMARMSVDWYVNALCTAVLNE